LPDGRPELDRFSRTVALEFIAGLKAIREKLF